MRIARLAAVLVLTAATITPALSAPGVTHIAANPDCNAQRKVCYASKTETDSNGVRYVPPDVVRDCEAAYRMCVAHH